MCRRAGRPSRISPAGALKRVLDRHPACRRLALPTGSSRTPIVHESEISPTRFSEEAKKPAKRRGRPKGAKNVKTILRALAHEKHTIREADETLTLTTVDLLFRMLAIKAMQGDIQANKFMDRFLERQSPPSNNAGYLVVPEDMSLEEFAVRADKLNRLAQPPVSLIELDELSKT